ncbi:hypothetical protein P5V30_21135 [Mycobacteroides abscessus subsp. abscessus]|uniref:hypothetical protein n=1 Tax=Mycobacteroides abscessus TaxID=36809 RepID=UPI0009415784|nr:hypothetical protein [Mycobacteroides abscessus]MDO2987041.1 hypothetical protein [Mycobacteroides abscessus subsp. abscessus]
MVFAVEGKAEVVGVAVVAGGGTDVVDAALVDGVSEVSPKMNGDRGFPSLSVAPAPSRDLAILGKNASPIDIIPAGIRVCIADDAVPPLSSPERVLAAAKSIRAEAIKDIT